MNESVSISILVQKAAEYHIGRQLPGIFWEKPKKYLISAQQAQHAGPSPENEQGSIVL
jgi:hypothetical protein